MLEIFRKEAHISKNSCDRDGLPGYKQTSDPSENKPKRKPQPPIFTGDYAGITSPKFLMISGHSTAATESHH